MLFHNIQCKYKQIKHSYIDNQYKLQLRSTQLVYYQNINKIQSMRTHKKNFRTANQRVCQKIDQSISFSLRRQENAEPLDKQVDRFAFYRSPLSHRQDHKTLNLSQSGNDEPRQINVFANYNAFCRKQQKIEDKSQLQNIDDQMQAKQVSKQMAQFEHKYNSSINNIRNGYSQQNFRQDFNNLMLNFIHKIVQNESMSVQKAQMHDYAWPETVWQNEQVEQFWAPRQNREVCWASHQNREVCSERHRSRPTYKIQYVQTKQQQKQCGKVYINRPIYTVKYCVQLIDGESMELRDTKYGQYCGGAINPNIQTTVEAICAELAGKYGCYNKYVVTSVIINNVKRQLFVELNCIIEHTLFQPLQYVYQTIDEENGVVYGLRVWSDKVQLQWHQPITYKTNNIIINNNSKNINKINSNSNNNNNNNDNNNDNDNINDNISNKLKDAVMIDGYSTKLEGWAASAVSIIYRKMTLSQYSMKCFEEFIELYNPDLLHCEHATISYDGPLNVGIICLP